MKVDHPPLFVSPKLSASSFTMPSRPRKRSRSRSRSRDGQVDRPLKRISLAPMNSPDVLPPRPVSHTVLPVIDFSQKLPISPMDGYSMTPLWEPSPQSDTAAQLPPPDENQVDDGDVRMDCDTTPKRLVSPNLPPPPSSNQARRAPNPTNTEGAPLRTPKPLASCPSLEMNELSPPVPQVPASQIVRSSQPKWPRFTMGPRSDCEKCRAGVKGHWGHLT